ncbi:MAG TPA: thiamine-phosphate kinase [Hydrogenophaga sp.]|uniref:thiamine-phosphate kinase n=1 Tax=Hydrogenophaga sp. TaxID=1904254 RepID=UPI002CBCBE10|nr:thiamine-phosphate kinase [Hydrogenophaga sp.]HMN92881.1 thiamine-phosphate kinase [Hydrogenophaga sp.]HMP10908.1 thiamine-phosphate kinase [Hydrogenophaga sp.]
MDTHSNDPDPPDASGRKGGEFDLIRRHFRRERAAGHDQVLLGIGDDCALLRTQAGHALAVSSDMLVQDRHFLAGTDAWNLGHKALAVNLSDLAAMGARPLGFTLALALPVIDEHWLNRFSAGLHALADRHACPLVGGDTTRGPLNICITVFGEVRPDHALRRDGARAGDDIYLSGRTGEARLALEALLGTPWAAEAVTGHMPELQARLERPEPRLGLGQALAGVAHAAIDLSDGLAGDLGHVLTASGCGAQLHAARLPVGPALQGLPGQQRWQCLLAGGDDYELLFTAPPDRRARIEALQAACGTPLTRIGQITAGQALEIVDAAGQTLRGDFSGFDHFG